MRSHLRHPLDFKSLIPQWNLSFCRLCPQSDRTRIKVWCFQLNLNSRTQRGQWLWNGSQCQFPTLPEARSSRINLGIKISVNVKTNKSWRASILYNFSWCWCVTVIANLVLILPGVFYDFLCKLNLIIILMATICI